MIERELPNSSAIDKVTYDPATQRMAITFASGKSYDHDGVPQGVFEQLCDCESAGRYYAESIKGNYASADYQAEPRLPHQEASTGFQRAQAALEGKPDKPDTARPLVPANQARNWDR
jgi:hypothetical protein